jgi:hypothetical protein
MYQIFSEIRFFLTPRSHSLRDEFSFAKFTIAHVSGLFHYDYNEEGQILILNLKDIQIRLLMSIKEKFFISINF